MKNLEPEETNAVVGGLEPKQSPEQVAPDPASAADIVIDYNPEHPPQ